VLLGIDYLLVAHMPTPLGPALVLENHTTRPHVHQLAHHALNVEWPPVASVAVHNHCQTHGGGHPASHVQHLGLGQETEVGFAQVAGRNAVAGENHGGEADMLGDLGRQDIVHPWHNRYSPLADEGMDAFLVHGCLLFGIAGHHLDGPRESTGAKRSSFAYAEERRTAHKAK
jgi:hypothetical protein